MSNAARPTWSGQTKLIVTLVLLVIFAYLLYRFSALITPLVLAVILAYVLMPPVNFFQTRLKIHRVLAILLTYLILFATIGLVVMLVTPPLVRQATDIGLNFQAMLDQVNGILGRKIILAGVEVDGQMILGQLSGSLQGLIQPLFGSTLAVLADILSSLAWVVFIVVISIYLVKDQAKLRSWLASLPPPAYQADYVHLRIEISEIWSAFFRGQLAPGPGGRPADFGGWLDHRPAFRPADGRPGWPAGILAQPGTRDLAYAGAGPGVLPGFYLAPDPKLVLHAGNPGFPPGVPAV